MIMRRDMLGLSRANACRSENWTWELLRVPPPLRYNHEAVEALSKSRIQEFADGTGEEVELVGQKRFRRRSSYCEPATWHRDF